MRRLGDYLSNGQKGFAENPNLSELTLAVNRLILTHLDKEQIRGHFKFSFFNAGL